MQTLRGAATQLLKPTGACKMIRIALGFFIVFGTVGTMDIDPQFPLWQALAQSAVGLGLMYWGVKKVNERG